jgi:C_GCAxxG_C_C family probable redox protein
MKKSDIAMQGLKNGFNCAQAVSTAFSEDFGINKEQTAKMACVLGAGMARSGEVCGAVSGAFMVIGMKYGSSKPEDINLKEKSYEIGADFKKKFEEIHGTVICSKLIDADISTPEGMQAARAKGVFENICKGLVKDSVEILENMLEDK